MELDPLPVPGVRLSGVIQAGVLPPADAACIADSRAMGNGHTIEEAAAQ
jgi:hypothetical protein